MYDIEVSTIQDYIDECLFEPSYDWPEYEFNTRCYERWAANEILDRILRESMLFPENTYISPRKTLYRVIEDFMNEMDYQARFTDNKKHHLIFSTAKDTARDIGLLFV